MKNKKANPHVHSTPEGYLGSIKHKFKPKEKRVKHNPASVPLSLLLRHPPCRPLRRRRSFLLPLPPSLPPSLPPVLAPPVPVVTASVQHTVQTLARGNGPQGRPTRESEPAGYANPQRVCEPLG